MIFGKFPYRSPFFHQAKATSSSSFCHKVPAWEMASQQSRSCGDVSAAAVHCPGAPMLTTDLKQVLNSGECPQVGRAGGFRAAEDFCRFFPSGGARREILATWQLSKATWASLWIVRMLVSNPINFYRGISFRLVVSHYSWAVSSRQSFGLDFWRRKKFAQTARAQKVFRSLRIAGIGSGKGPRHCCKRNIF